MKRLLKILGIAGLGALIMGALGDNGLNLPLGLQEAFEHYETHEDHPTKGHHHKASAPQKQDFKPETLKAEQNPASSFELPEHRGVAFLEEVYTGEPLMVAQDLGVEQRGAMGFDITKRDAISSLGACAHWIVSCVEPNERSLDQCVAAAPTCQSERPWEADEHTFCCPAACTDNYAKARLSADTDLEAFTSTFFTNPTCFPEALELLNSGPPTPDVP